MAETSSVTSSTATFVANRTADLNKAASAATTSFASALTKVEIAIGIKPKTGFSAGPTYEANTLAGQTKAAFDNALSATKSALHIKP